MSRVTPEMRRIMVMAKKSGKIACESSAGRHI